MEDEGLGIKVLILMLVKKYFPDMKLILYIKNYIDSTHEF